MAPSYVYLVKVHTGIPRWGKSHDAQEFSVEVYDNFALANQSARQHYNSWSYEYEGPGDYVSDEEEDEDGTVDISKVPKDYGSFFERELSKYTKNQVSVEKVEVVGSDVQQKREREGEDDATKQDGDAKKAKT